MEFGYSTFLELYLVYQYRSFENLTARSIALVEKVGVLQCNYFEIKEDKLCP